MQLLLPSGYVPDYDKVTLQFMLNGDADKTVQLMDSTYEQQGKDKKVPGLRSCFGFAYRSISIYSRGGGL